MESCFDGCISQRARYDTFRPTPAWIERYLASHNRSTVFAVNHFKNTEQLNDFYTATLRNFVNQHILYTVVFEHRSRTDFCAHVFVSWNPVLTVASTVRYLPSHSSLNRTIPSVPQSGSVLGKSISGWGILHSIGGRWENLMQWVSLFGHLCRTDTIS